MGTERTIKHGYAKDDFEALSEAKKLGPYPPWKGWKNKLERHLADRDLQMPNCKLEKVLHSWYNLRRLNQNKTITRQEFNERKSEMFDTDKAESYFKDPNFSVALKFITEVTKPPKTKKLTRIG